MCASLEKIIFKAKPNVSDLSNHKEAQFNFQRLFQHYLISYNYFICLRITLVGKFGNFRISHFLLHDIKQKKTEE